MTIKQIQDTISRCSSDTEEIYLDLSRIFPELLSANATAGGNTLGSLNDILNGLLNGCSAYQEDERGFFEGINKKNQLLFDQLNAQMASLDQINRSVSDIRTDSEELEIISLNAMVISIKSGEKGRAFSCITENLKKLSARMIALSNELMFDEKSLLERNAELAVSFETVQQERGALVTISASGTQETLVERLAAASGELQDLSATSAQVLQPIRSAMAGIQLQDIIRQSIDQVLLALSDINTRDDGSGTASGAEAELDRVAFNCEIYGLCASITKDVSSNLKESIQVFRKNWDAVDHILETVESRRKYFIASYLDASRAAVSVGSIPLLLTSITDSFHTYITHLGAYQRGQKNMVRDSLAIVTEVKRLRSLFETIRPIIARLQHVRITQQIEVAKNPAIAAVKDTVEHMNDLIVGAEQRVEQTHKELVAFIKAIETLTATFGADTEIDNRLMERIRDDKTAFFSRMRRYQDELLSAMTNVQVYPPAFTGLCSRVDSLIGRLIERSSQLDQLVAGLEDLAAEAAERKTQLLSAAGLSSWSIHNDRFNELVQRFTITAHKQEAGARAGIATGGDTLSSIESGDVTLFF